MAETSHTWTCTACGRRVPLRVSVCHCGVSRAQSDAVRTPTPGPSPLPLRPGWRALWSSFPRDVQSIAAAAALVLLAGLGWLVFGPPPRNDTPALLGYVDRRPPAAAPAPPPIKLPWWK